MIATIRRRDFLLAWLGGLVSMIGDWVLLIALPLHVYQLTGSTLATSGMFIAGIIPALLLGSVAGVFVDRWDRKRTMVITNLILAVTLRRCSPSARPTGSGWRTLSASRSRP